METIEYEVRKDFIENTSIVVGTSGALMKPQLKSLYHLGKPFGALLTDESSMPETGEEISKMMNLNKQEMVVMDARTVFIGDLTQEGPTGTGRCVVWSNAKFLQYTSFTRSIFELLFSTLKGMSPNELDAKVVFVNAIRQSHRVGLIVAAMINALVDTELLNEPPWVRQEGEPPTKPRKTTSKANVVRKEVLTLLRPPLVGNPNRKDEAKAFFDLSFYRKVRTLLEHDYAVGQSKYCMVSTFIGAPMMIHCGMLPAKSQENEGNLNVVLATGPYRAQSIMLAHCVKLLLEKLPDHRRDLLMKTSVLQTGTTTSQQSRTTKHTVLLTLAVLHKWTPFGCKAQKIVNALSRHISQLFLIQPFQVQTMHKVPKEVERLHALFHEFAFSNS